MMLNWPNAKRGWGCNSPAEFQLENTLAALGTLYTQLQPIGAKDVDSGRPQRLQEDITAQIASLQDSAEAMDEVYMSRRSQKPKEVDLTIKEQRDTIGIIVLTVSIGR